MSAAESLTVKLVSSQCCEGDEARWWVVFGCRAIKKHYSIRPCM